MTIAEKLQLIARNVQKVFDAGKKAEYDKFWDSFQKNGTEGTYNYRFMNWNADIFYPKYPIVFGGAQTQVFMQMNAAMGEYDREFDFSQRLKDCNIYLDTSEATGLNYLFYYVGTKSVPEINATKCTTFTNMFAYSSVVTIQKLILNTSGDNQTFDRTFNNARQLENIEIEGCIGNNIDFKSCVNLSTESLRSILKALSKDASIANGKAITFRTSHQAKIENDSECTSYASAATNAGWSIAYNS